MIKNLFKIFILFFFSLNSYAEKTLLPIFDYQSVYHPTIGTNGMVVSQRELASKIGADILKKGGNAVDAAVATAFALAVVLPRAGNLGGGGFMLVYLAKEDKTIAIDYREKAPLRATRDLFLDSAGNYDKTKARFSLLSAGVPGTVAGLSHALEKYGTMSWSEVITPALNLAKNGFEVTHDIENVLTLYKKRLTSNLAASKAYYKKDNVPYRAGEVLKLPDLAWSLQQLKSYGPKAFYQGKIAQKIVDEMEKNGGIISLEDLDNYHVSEREPLTGTYNGFNITSMPPSSSGGVHLIQMLNILESFSLKEMGFGSANYIHLLSEVMKRAYADRSLFLGDLDFTEVPLIGLTNKDYAKSISKIISLEKATNSVEVLVGDPLPYESPDTTHFSVMDKMGNAVSNTYTLNFSYGSGIVIPGTGFFMNNEMDDFSSKPGTPNAFGLIGAEANSIAPSKRPLSSMTPTIIFKDGQPYAILGSPGGSRIITTVLQVVLNLIEFKMNIAQAVASPRIHHQWLPDVLLMESGFSQDTLNILEQKGHKLREDRTMGSVQAILKEGSYFYGAADPRRPGAAAIAVSP
jgi:gamma-glutamyltranspeptidase / glutathione hydrolase